MRTPREPASLRSIALVAFALGLSLGCTPRDDSETGDDKTICRPGAERCACSDGIACAADLTCLSGVCVDAPGGSDTSSTDNPQTEEGDDDESDLDCPLLSFEACASAEYCSVYLARRVDIEASCYGYEEPAFCESRASHPDDVAAWTTPEGDCWRAHSWPHGPGWELAEPATPCHEAVHGPDAHLCEPGASAK